MTIPDDCVSAWAAPPGSPGFDWVWPRRFDLETIRGVLGPEAEERVCDVLATAVNAPIWTLVDRGGGRWRPVISRLAFLASGGVPPVPGAVFQVAELLHTGSLVIDDIQDGSRERRGGPAAHAIHGVPAALNAANTAYFRALAVLRGVLADDRRLRALDMLAEELFAAHLGQALDLALGELMRRGTSRVGHYALLAGAKTGALVRIATRLGAIAAGADDTREAALATWAGEVGVAYQIRNDLEDLEAGMHDVVTCRPTFPLLLILEDGGLAATALRDRLGCAALSEGDVRELRALFARGRIAERGRAAVTRAVARALEVLGVLPGGEARTGLERITRDLGGQPGTR